MSDQRFALSGPEIVHETVDGETIVVNLETGTYYDLNPAGACLFNALVRDPELESAVGVLCSRFSVDHGTAARDAGRLVDELVAEELFVPADGEQPPHVSPSSAEPPIESGAEPAPYVAPALGKYTDMQELLLLDPVHDVDEQGWPLTP